MILPDPAVAHAPFVCAIALSVEATLGYPPALFRLVGHPVTWLGAEIAWCDRRWNREGDAPATRRLAGFAALVVVLASAGMAAGAVAVALPGRLAVVPLGVLASSCLAQRSLHAHVRAVADALDARGIEAARRAVAMIVGRDTAAMDEAAVARAAIESLAENFADGVVAPAFWLALAGLPGGVLYKAINTADSMIAHRTPRHEAFGFAAAKLDDAANWPPARLAALLLVAAAALVPGASARDAWRIGRRDAAGHPSPNAGWPEAAMAGALGIRLGGPRSYGGRLVIDAAMGEGTEAANGTTIRRALRLYRVACVLNIAAVGLAAISCGLLRRQNS